VVGVTTLQFGSKPGTGGQAERGTSLKRSAQTSKNPTSPELVPGCQSIGKQLQDFLDVKEPSAPKECYDPNRSLWKKLPEQVAEETSKLKFVIATLPDPMRSPRQRHWRYCLVFDHDRLAGFRELLFDTLQQSRYGIQTGVDNVKRSVDCGRADPRQLDLRRFPLHWR
jgi:hypothetical protein